MTMQFPDRIVSGSLALAATGALFAAASTSVLPSGESVLGDGGTEKSLPPGPVLDIAEVAGSWDIVRFDGHTPQRRQGATRAAFADFTEGAVQLRIECNLARAAGQIEGGRFLAQGGSATAGARDCGPEGTARETDLFGFFGKRPQVERLDDGTLRLMADDTELLLERSDNRRLAFVPDVQELLGEWRLTEIARHRSDGRYAGIGLTGVRGYLSFDGIAAKFSGCPQFAVTYRYTADGRIEKIAGPALPDRQTDCEALSGEWGGRDMPVPWDAVRILHAEPLVERVDKDTILLTSEDMALLLTRMD